MIRERPDSLPRGSGLGVPLSPFQARSSRKEKTQRPDVVSGPAMALQREGLGSWERALGGLLGLQVGSQRTTEGLKPVRNGTSHIASLILFEVLFVCLFFCL